VAEGSQAAVTRSQLEAELRELGVRPGGMVMVHARMSALGWVVGGSETIVRALLDALAPDGTLAAYASWQEHVYHAEDWPAQHRAAYLAEPPAFDPATGAVDRDYGQIPERIRTWPGALRSTHPEASVVALGPRAEWLTAVHPPDDGYGPRSPFARLVEAGGHVLMLGAPLETLTLLHHAESIAAAPGKRRVTYTVPVVEGDGVVERSYTDIETSSGAYPYERLGLDDDEFAVIAREALAAGIGASGRVGAARSHLFPAAEVVPFAVGWIESRFGA
jgi:aminoglycoside 3-N-acetyltransferase